MSAKRFFQETLGTNKKRVPSGFCSTGYIKGGGLLTVWGVYASGCYCCDFKIELSDAMRFLESLVFHLF